MNYLTTPEIRKRLPTKPGDIPGRFATSRSPAAKQPLLHSARRALDELLGITLPAMGEASMPEQLVDEARRRGVRLDAANARNLEAIDTFGWAVVMVAPRRGESFAPFAYTIGLSRHPAPELIIVGIDASPAAQILNDIGSITRREPIDVGPLPGILAGGHVLDLRKVDRRHYNDYLGRLLWFHKQFGAGPLRVLQAIWPDKQGRYPDDPRLTEGERAFYWRRQPMLDRAFD